MARKLWSTTFLPGAERQRHDSQAAAYRHVEETRQYWAGSSALPVQVMSVWVDERTGHGWQLFERIDFTEEGTS